MEFELLALNLIQCLRKTKVGQNQKPLSKSRVFWLSFLWSHPPLGIFIVLLNRGSHRETINVKLDDNEIA